MRRHGRGSQRTYQLMIPLEGPRRRASEHLPSRVLVYCATLALLTVSGCAIWSAPKPEMGVRPHYASQEVASVAIIHVGAASTWDMPAAQFEEVRRTYEAGVSQELAAMGIETIDRATVEDRLTQTPLEGKLAQALDIDRPLEELFEEISPHGLDARVEHVMTLGKVLGVDTVLIGQIVYHTESVCRGTVDSEYTPHVATPNGPPTEEWVPCSVSHFEAKLVDTRTGRTVWYNRALRESRAQRADQPAPDPLDNARETVALVMSKDPAGLQVMVRR